MASDYDATEFVDGDFQQRNSASGAGASSGGPGQRAPSREEIDAQIAEAQQQLAELERKREEKKREQAALEETRRRQAEFQTGRQEMAQNLTRGIGLLEEAEFNHRRDAEQMAKTLADFKDALAKVQAIHEETWTHENLNVELTRALTTLENARMEWNSARLKYPLLSAPPKEQEAAPAAAPIVPAAILDQHTFGELCRVGFALTWPVALMVLAGVVVLALVLLRH